MNGKIANIRLSNHQLLGANDTMPHQIVAHFGMMQAQDFNFATWAVGLRLGSCTEKLVHDDINNGKILRTHVLRPTWHFVTPENIRWMLQLSAKRIMLSMKSRDRELGLTDEVYTKCYHLIESALEKEDNLTRDGLMNVFQNAGMEFNASQMYHVLAGAEANGLICSGVLYDKQHTYTLLEKRVPAIKPLTKEESMAKLARIYFTGHGPATLQDFVWWSGLSTGEARQGLEAVQPGFVSETIDGQKYWMPDIDYQPPAGNTLCLLPAFDEYIVGYKDRTAVITSENHKKAISSNGVFRPVVVKNGRVTGLWKKASSANKPIIITPFEPIDPATQQLIDRAAEKLKMFFIY
jgi:hypothetical protein